MTEWSRLRHAYGPAGDIPGLLEQLDPDPDVEVWEKLWSRLCHQGDVYSASVAALPALTTAVAAWPAAARFPGLNLAAAIIAAADRSRGLGDARQRYGPEISTLAQLTAESLRVTDPSDPVAFIYLLQAALAFDGVPIWEEELEGLADGEYQAPCPACGVTNYIVIGEHGRFTAVEDYVANNAATRNALRSAAPGSLDGLAKRLYCTALDAGQLEVADRLTHLFGQATCGRCETTYAVADAITAAYAV